MKTNPAAAKVRVTAGGNVAVRDRSDPDWIWFRTRTPRTRDTL